MKPPLSPLDACSAAAWFTNYLVLLCVYIVYSSLFRWGPVSGIWGGGPHVASLFQWGGRGRGEGDHSHVASLFQTCIWGGGPHVASLFQRVFHATLPLLHQSTLIGARMDAILTVCTCCSSWSPSTHFPHNVNSPCTPQGGCLHGARRHPGQHLRRHDAARAQVSVGN